MANGSLPPWPSVESVTRPQSRSSPRPWTARTLARANAAYAIGFIGPGAVTASMLAALANALGDDETDVRRGVAFALTQLGPAAATAGVLAALRLALRDVDGTVQHYASNALANARSFQLLAATLRERRTRRLRNWGVIALCLLVAAAWGLLVALNSLGFLRPLTNR